MTLYESLSIAIAAITLGVTIWAHIRISKTNSRIQNIQKLSPSGGQSPIIVGSNVNIYNYLPHDNKTP